MGEGEGAPATMGEREGGTSSHGRVRFATVTIVSKGKALDIHKPDIVCIPVGSEHEIGYYLP